MTEQIIDFPRYTRWTWIIAVLLLLTLVALWLMGRGPSASSPCCGSTNTDAAAVTPVATTPPAPDAADNSTKVVEPLPAAAPSAVAGPLAVIQAGGKVRLTGVVADEAARSQIVGFAKSQFGTDRVIDELTVDAASGARPWADKLGEIFGWQKTVPDAGISYADGRVVLTGTVTSEAEKTARGEQAQTYFGPDVAIDNQIKVLEIAAAGSNVQCGDRIAVAINFATGSSALNAEAKKVLDQVFECLKTGKYEISGHTDNTGSASGNQRLSNARAQATKDYLVGKGASADDLSAAGYGADKPIASNDTAEGKAQNRRIEFTKQ
jgi:OmpA-OmpF porin, OOP family